MGVKGGIIHRLGVVAGRHWNGGGKTTKDQFYQWEKKLLEVGSAFSF